LNKKRALGRGLEALLSVAGNEKDGSLKEIDIENVIPNPRQPRLVVNEEKLSELAGSIKEHGIVQPVVVRPLENGKYELIAGERRWRACLSLDMKKIPALVREYGDLEASAVALIENVQRENLNPLEEARAYRILMDDFGLTQEELSRRVSKSRPFVGNMVRLLTLPDEVQQMVMDKSLSTGHARAVLGLQEPMGQLAAARRIVKGQMNVRQAERLVKALSEKVRVRRKVRNREYRQLEADVGAFIPATVKIKETRDGGVRITMDFKTPVEAKIFFSAIRDKPTVFHPE